jgi:hypothetical protein
MGYLILLKFLSKNFWIWEEGYTYITRKFDCALSSEYCYLDRKFMFSTSEITEEEESKYFELKDLLFAGITIG